MKLLCVMDSFIKCNWLNEVSRCCVLGKGGLGQQGLGDLRFGQWDKTKDTIHLEVGIKIEGGRI